MYKQHSKHTLSAQLNAFQKICPNPNTQQLSKSPNYSSKFDLQKFNDYLQQRISRKANRNEVEVSRRENSQKRSSHQLNYKDQTVPQNIQKDLGLQKFRESRVSKSREILSPKITWRKHQSIQNLLEKENHSVLSGNRRTESQSQEYALKQLQRKYQELQQKYKILMKQASQNARIFEADKRELTKIKLVHQEDQQILSKLRKELLVLHENMNKTMENPLQKSVFKCKSQQIIDSDSSTILSSLNPIQTWKSKEGREEKTENLKFSRNKTTENWRNNFDKSIVIPQSQSKNKTKELRYYSAQKQMESARRQKKASEHSNFGNIQSKSSIKCGDSMRGSKIRVSAKPGTQTLIRLQNEFSKNAGGNTLHKKMISSNQYSKYRFKPTFKCQ